MREQIFAVLLVVGAGLVVAGVAWFSVGVALVVAGVLVAGLAWLLLGDIGGTQSRGTG